MKEEEIFKELQAIKNRALALYSNFRVGALLITRNDQLIPGFNIEFSSYSLTICAERVALFRALSEGFTEFQRIYIISDDDEPCPPCGACRQALVDFAPDIEIVMFSNSGQRRTATLKELLPQAFSKNNLKK